nr:ubiquitin carboxyl-terminal hydrolase 20-like [Tanacetum cinerariifolium]
MDDSLTVKRYKSKPVARRTNINVHFCAHQLFDQIAQQKDVVDDDDDELEDLKDEEADELLLADELIENCDVDDDDDDTKAWISSNREKEGECKPVMSVVTSSSGWNEDAYEKPSLVGAGLANLGNSCFFNAVMQCFTHSVLLVQGLNSQKHPTPCDCSNERFCLICALREQVELSLTSPGKIVSPWKFVDNLSYFSSSFKRYQQEDAHEFLQCFLDRLESSLINLKVKDDALPSESDNLVKQVFGGRVISKLRCCNCNYISDTYEPSVDLSLEIDNANSLLTALESFTKIEHIEDEEMKFTCDHCKEKVSVDKQLMLDQIPSVCAFHLKRFKNDGSWVEKIDKHVDFPLELDLQPFTCGGQTDNVDLKYELYAVVVHTAFTSTCGHYYCYIRSAPDTWHKFDDSKVTSVSEDSVLQEEAYILFYAKEGTPWFASFMETYKPSLANLSNTSPKSVLENVDHISTSHDPLSIIADDMKGSFSRSTDTKVSEAKDHSSRSDAVGTLSPDNRVIKETTPLSLKQYGSNYRVEAQKTTNVTPTSQITFQSAFDFDYVLSPRTPPRSPGLDISEDENTEVVFAAKPVRLKVAEKTSNKRKRGKDEDYSAKVEAAKMCRKMPGARGKMFMEAMSSKSDNVLNKKSKKMSSPSIKNHRRTLTHAVKRFDLKLFVDDFWNERKGVVFLVLLGLGISVAARALLTVEKSIPYIHGGLAAGGGGGGGSGGGGGGGYGPGGEHGAGYGGGAGKGGGAGYGGGAAGGGGGGGTGGGGGGGGGVEGVG